MFSRKDWEWRLPTSAEVWTVEQTQLKHRKLMIKLSLKAVAVFRMTGRSTESNMDYRAKEKEANNVVYKVRCTRTELKSAVKRGRQEMGEKSKVFKYGQTYVGLR